MSKSVLIVDTPESCWKCSLRNANECIVAEKTITRREYGKRQAWCPLRKLPEKVQVSGTYGKGNTPESYDIWWNACIDALKKQIPRKVDEEGFCPVCGSWCADEDENVDNYCMNCGQKLQAAGSEEA